MTNPILTTRAAQDWAQPVLILLSLLLAYRLPFEGVFVAYAILGPLHYLTQISWLHDRKYFFHDPSYRRLFVALSVVMACWLVLPAQSDTLARPSHYGIAFMVLSLFLMPLFLNSAARRGTQLLLLCAVPLIVWGLLNLDVFILLGATLIPTFVHIAVFTFIFLLHGARRNGDAASVVSAATWLGAALLIVFFPPIIYLHFVEWFEKQRAFFDPVAVALGAQGGGLLDAGWSRAYGLLTFAFTYHYLNWFSKTELLKWHRIPRRRMAAIVVVYLAALALYFYNFRLGFRALLSLSAIHIFLEFPLNVQTIRDVFRVRGKNKSLE